jgi:NAD+ synthase (glutamine-hydrolysing)
MRIAGAALNQTPLDWLRNTQNIREAIARARAERADLLLLPELCLTGYGCEDLFLAEWLSTAAWKQLEQILPHTQGITVCIGLPLRLDGHTYNGVCVARDGRVLGVTLKQNLARDGVHYEPRWFSAWKPNWVVTIQKGEHHFEAGDVIYTLNGVCFGFEICEDAWREERPASQLSRRGVKLILNPSASHFAMGKSSSRQELVRRSSEQFNCTYLYVNLLGNEAGRMIYDGDIILAGRGQLLLTDARLSMQPVRLRWADVDTEQPEATAKNIAAEPDRNEELAQAAALALFDYLVKSRASGFVLSLSGGADSGCCAVLVSEMVQRAIRELGWETFCQRLKWDAAPVKPEHATGRLLSCAYQGTVNSSPATRQAAEELARSIGATFFCWTVDPEVDGYTKKIGHSTGRQLNWQANDVALQNIQARARSPVIWMLANVQNAILLTTSNRSEGSVGYATMDGDTSGSLAPIAGLDKPFIRQWLRWAETNLHYHGLHRINRLEPTAELRPPDQAQTDEKDLMPYAVLNQIERLALWERKSPLEVYHELNQKPGQDSLKAHIKKFFRLWAANQWKRERLAPSFHLADLNIDPRSWCRFPILSGNFEQELDDLDGEV